MTHLPMSPTPWRAGMKEIDKFKRKRRWRVDGGSMIKDKIVKRKKKIEMNILNKKCFFFMIADAVGSHLKVLIRQVDLQAKRVDTLGQRPGHKICQGVRGLTKPGQHVLH